MAWEKSTCPICRSGADRQAIGGVHGAYYYNNCKCQGFAISRHDQANFLDIEAERAEYHPKRITTLLRERRINKFGNPLLLFQLKEHHTTHKNYSPVYVPELLAKWPETVQEKIERSLCNLAKLSTLPGYEHEIDRFVGKEELFFAEHNIDKTFYMDALLEYGWVEVTNADDRMQKLRITPSGWARFDELTRGKNSPNNPVFVAMWFGGKQNRTEMTKLWEIAIRPAVKDSGYKVKRADSDEHNEYIMDKIRADIRKAPFVVSDLSNQNQGVYYEAGFAAGLGLEVVYCCPITEKLPVHFDVAQINRILYEDAEDLRKKLAVRIQGSIGEGPFPVLEKD